MEMKNNRLILGILFAGILLDGALVWTLFRYFNFPAYLLAIAAAGLGYAIIQTTRIRNRRLLISCAVFSCLLSLSFIYGGKVNTVKKIYTPVKGSDFWYWIALAAVFFFVFSWAADFIMRHPVHLTERILLSPKAVWPVCSVFFFICWIPCLFVYYPGSVSPDSLACIIRAIGKAGLSNQQPVFYILLMKPFLMFSLAIGKSLNFGAALFLCFQTAAMAAMVGYLPCWLTKKHIPLWIIGLVMAYFILDPVFALFSSTMWKDILFGALMMLYVLNVFDIVQSKGEWLKTTRNLVWFVVLNLLISFMRNNGYYIAFVTLVVFGILYRANWKKLVPSFLAILILVPVIQGPVYRVCGITPSPFAESVGIPLQQIGYTAAHNGTITKEQSDFLNQLLPLEEMKKAYSPFSSNNIKFHKDFNNQFLEKNKVTFLKVWAGILKSNLSNYVKAYILQTLGYWHVGTSSWVVYGGILNGYGAQEAGLSMTNIANLAGNRNSLQQSFDNLQTAIPILSGLVNIGVLFWASVFSAFLLIIRKKGRYLLAFLPLLVLWGTLMLATPTFCEFRYMFAFAVSLPAVALFAFPTKKSQPVAGTSSASGEQA